MNKTLTCPAARTLLLAALAALTAGCPYTPPETDHPHLDRAEPITGRDYWLYVPSYYEELSACPVVVTLHGTNPWDGKTRQILEWKDTAERHGLIVVAPQLKSTQGYVPVIPSVWYADNDDLLADERAILAVIDHVRKHYRVARRAGKPGGPPGKELIALTGFSSGGFPMYHTGLRNPGRFDILIARDCNSSLELLESIELSPEAKDLPIVIFWGRDDLPAIREQSWEAFRYLRTSGCHNTRRDEIRGGHLRRPDVAYREWVKSLPKEFRR